VLDALVTDILGDFTGDDGLPLVIDAYVRRQAERALPVVATDVRIAYVLDGDDVFPVMPADHRELWALQTKILVCRHLRAQAASRVSFSSGDKRMDRSREASNWADLEKAFADEYAERVRRVNPAADSSVMRVDVVPVVFEAGGEVDPC
jgi:hypothetical protein